MASRRSKLPRRMILKQCWLALVCSPCSSRGFSNAYCCQCPAKRTQLRTKKGFPKCLLQHANVGKPLSPTIFVECGVGASAFQRGFWLLPTWVALPFHGQAHWFMAWPWCARLCIAIGKRRALHTPTYHLNLLYFYPSIILGQYWLENAHVWPFLPWKDILIHFYLDNWKILFCAIFWHLLPWKCLFF